MREVRRWLTPLGGGEGGGASAVLGAGSDNGGLGIRRQLSSYNIDSSLSKESEQSFPIVRLANVCRARDIKNGFVFFSTLLEIGILFGFKEPQLTRITSLNATRRSVDARKGFLLE